MLLVEFTISGTINYVSNEALALTNWFAPYVESFTAPRLQTPQQYGGYANLAFGDITFSPDLFASDWPPPKQCPITIKYTNTTEAAATTLFEGYAYINSFDQEKVSYMLYDKIYPKRLLTMGLDYNGNTVPYPKAFGVVTHVSPLRLADDLSGYFCYHLGGIATGTLAIAIDSFDSYDSGNSTKVTLASAHGWSNGDSVVINGTYNFDGVHTISGVSGATFVIATDYPTDDSEYLPIQATAYEAGAFCVYDDGVPIMENVVINGDGTFSLNSDPVGEVSISGTGVQTTLLDVMTWGQTQLGIASIDHTYDRATSPDVSYWATEQMPLIDFLSEVCAFFTHLFYIYSDTLYLVDMFTDNTTSTLTEFDFFKSAQYSAPDIISQIEARWTTREAVTGFNDGVSSSRYLDTVENSTVVSIHTVSSGTTDSTSSGKLMDSAASFITDGVVVGMIAQNTTDDTDSIITAVAANNLTLEDDIFESGETYVVGPSMPYAKDMEVTPYHDTKANIDAALEDILEILNKDYASISIPLSTTLCVPGKKITFPDTSLIVDTSSYIRCREISYDFDAEKVVIAGEGVIS